MRTQNIGNIPFQAKISWPTKQKGELWDGWSDKPKCTLSNKQMKILEKKASLIGDDTDEIILSHDISSKSDPNSNFIYAYAIKDPKFPGEHLVGMGSVPLNFKQCIDFIDKIAELHKKRISEM